MTVTSYTLDYFPLRGRAECLRLAMHAAGVPFNEVPTDYAKMKEAAGSEVYPFGQSPILVTPEGKRIAQMDAGMRHLARKFDLYGEGEEEMCLVDAMLHAVEDMRSSYAQLIYMKQLSDEGKEEYKAAHIESGGLSIRNKGAHFQYFQNFLERNGGGEGFVVGKKLSVADIHLFDILDLHLRPALFPEEVKKNFPKLVDYHKRISEIPAIADYLRSAGRHAKINGVDLG